MGVLATIEDALLQVTRDALTTPDGSPLVREVESLPGTWSVDTLQRILQRAPGAYLAWLGGKAEKGTEAMLTASWSLYAVTSHASGSQSRRRGDAQEIGAYEVLERTVPYLHGHDTDAGRLELERVEPLVNEATFQLGASVYVATFRLPRMVLPLPVDEGDLDDFVTFHATYDLDTSQDDEPEAEDTIELQ